MWSRAAVQATGEDLLPGSAQQGKRCKRKQQNMFIAKSTKKYHQLLALPTLHCSVSSALLTQLYMSTYCYKSTVLRQFDYMTLGAGLGWDDRVE